LKSHFLTVIFDLYRISYAEVNENLNILTELLKTTGLKENSKQMNFLKIMVVVSIVVSIVCVGIVFRNATAIIKICQNLGGGC
jgi:hypothetical protein